MWRSESLAASGEVLHPSPPPLALFDIQTLKNGFLRHSIGSIGIQPRTSRQNHLKSLLLEGLRVYPFPRLQKRGLIEAPMSRSGLPIAAANFRAFNSAVSLKHPILGSGGRRGWQLPRLQQLGLIGAWDEEVEETSTLLSFRAFGGLGWGWFRATRTRSGVASGAFQRTDHWHPV